MNLFDLSGRVGLVTGSSRGIGFALAKGLLQVGARVVIHGREVEQATISATTLAQETGGQTRVSTFDVTDLAAVDRGIAAIEHDWGTPDLLVNNAGVQRRKNVRRVRSEGLERPAGHQPDERFPRQPAGRPGNGGTRQRQDHQYRVGAEPAGPPRDRMTAVV
jgi:NAD(P)-dependent dehydrogenase (short-subunit alcohol dehydrogenase family)